MPETAVRAHTSIIPEAIVSRAVQNLAHEAVGVVFNDSNLAIFRSISENA